MEEMVMRIHVYLDDDAAENAILIARAWNRSVGDSVNFLLSHITAAELTEGLAVTIKREEQAIKPKEPKVKTVRTSRNFTMNW